MLTEYTYPGGCILLEDDNPTTPKKVALEYEARKVRWLMDYLKSGMTFVDVGAHHGYYTLLAAKLVQETGCIVAFEMEYLNHDVLIKNVHQNRYENVYAYNMALGDTDWDTVYYALNKQSGRHSLWLRAKDGNWVAERQMRFDTVWSGEYDHQIRNPVKKYPLPDIIKIDTEGHEYQVVQGMEQTLKANLNCKVILEVHPTINPESTKAVDLLNEWGIEIV